MVWTLFCLSMLTPSLLPAQEEQDSQDPPSLELLEFLGAFEDEDTGWLDPFTLPGVNETHQETDEEELNDEN